MPITPVSKSQAMRPAEIAAIDALNLAIAQLNDVTKDQITVVDNWITNASSSNFYVAKYGRIGLIRIGGVRIANALPTGTNTTVGTLPSDYLPLTPINSMLAAFSGDHNAVLSLSGTNVIFRNTGSVVIPATTALFGSLVFLTNS